MIGYLSKEQAEALLGNNNFGRIGCNDGFNTYIFPTNYVYDGKYILCHSFAGAKINAMRNNKRVCFLVDEIEKPDNWKSVMILGDYEELDDERERYHAMKAFNENDIHLKISETAAFPNDTLHPDRLYELGHFRPVIYRISLQEITGRFEGQ